MYTHTTYMYIHTYNKHTRQITHTHTHTHTHAHTVHRHSMHTQYTCTHEHKHVHVHPYLLILHTLAVAIGRFVMGLFWMTNPPEIYTAAIGLYFLWLIIRVSISLYGYVSDGALQFMSQVSLTKSI